MLKRLYDWTMEKARSRNATLWLGGVSFAESSFFPIPPDLLLIPMILADRKSAWKLATICTITSVIGGLAGYAIGYFLYETIGRWVIDLYNLTEQFDALRQTFVEYGAEILIVKGMTPIPYKLLTITAGVAHLALPIFIGASILSRAMRFYLVAALLYFFGEPIRDFIEKRLTLVTSIAAVLFISGFLVVKFI